MKLEVTRDIQVPPTGLSADSKPRWKRFLSARQKRLADALVSSLRRLRHEYVGELTKLDGVVYIETSGVACTFLRMNGGFGDRKRSAMLPFDSFLLFFTTMTVSVELVNECSRMLCIVLSSSDMIAFRTAVQLWYHLVPKQF